MEKTVKKVASVTGSLMLLAGMTAPGTAAFADEAVQGEAAESECPVHAGVNVVDASQKADKVFGSFSYTQQAVTSNKTIAKTLGTAAQYLCGSNLIFAESESLDAWELHVGGDVANEFSATLDELAQEEVSSVVMGCSCSGNPADGTATANALVTGVAITSIMDAAELEAGVNTIVFTSADGYEMALPLTYVAQRYSLIVFDVNGAPLADSVGGTNQLWLGSTSARYFARDVTSISYETREVAPPAPGSAAAQDNYANVPNVAVSSASSDNA